MRKGAVTADVIPQIVGILVAFTILVALFFLADKQLGIVKHIKHVLCDRWGYDACAVVKSIANIGR